MKKLLMITLFLFVLAACETEITKVPIEPVDAMFQIEVDGITREYQLYIPENTFEGAPLVVMLHGFTQTHLQLKALSEMDAVADEHAFAVVYPLGTRDRLLNQPHWNAGLELSEVDDVFFIETLIQTLQETYSLSQNDVFISGFSNGGFMAYTLLCETNNLFKAIAPVSGLMSSETAASCEAPDPVNILHIHGTADAVVPALTPMFPIFGFGGGPILMDLLETLRLSYDLPAFTESNYKDSILKMSTSSTTQTIELYLIDDYGHFWPSAARTETFDPGLEASIVIWDFFARFVDENR
jgi:polyhydroxybutyrate depolymerase